MNHRYLSKCVFVPSVPMGCSWTSLGDGRGRNRRPLEVQWERPLVKKKRIRHDIRALITYHIYPGGECFDKNFIETLSYAMW